MKKPRKLEAKSIYSCLPYRGWKDVSFSGGSQWRALPFARITVASSMNSYALPQQNADRSQPIMIFCFSFLHPIRMVYIFVMTFSSKFYLLKFIQLYDLFFVYCCCCFCSCGNLFFFFKYTQ